MKKKVYSCQCYGSSGSVEIEIYVELNREFNDSDGKRAYEAGEKLKNDLFLETVRLNPDIHKQAAEIKKNIISVFGGREIYVEEIPNGYCSSFCCTLYPWFVVTTKVGRIKIGWRKRVINIDWSGSDVLATAIDLFATEDVTKGERCIHAWGYTKAEEYINKILNDKKIDEK